MNNNNKLREFDAAQFLDNEETISAYIAQSMTDATPELLLSAISDVVRARSINQLAEKTGLRRKIVYDALKQGSRPEKEILAKIIEALNVLPQTVASEN